MKLSDIMSHSGLSAFAEVALVIFLAVFIGVTIRTFAPSRRQEMHRASMLPLDDGEHVADHSSSLASRGT